MAADVLITGTERSESVAGGWHCRYQHRLHPYSQWHTTAGSPPVPAGTEARGTEAIESYDLELKRLPQPFP